MSAVKCSECNITANLTKCNEETCDKMYCETHVEEFLNECEGGCSGLFCKDDGEVYDGETMCDECKEAFDQEY